MGEPAPSVTDNLKSKMESVARREIGAAYSLCLNHQIKDNLEMFDFLITEL